MEVHFTLGTKKLLELRDHNLERDGKAAKKRQVPSVENNLELQQKSVYKNLCPYGDETYSLRRSTERDLGKVLRVHEVYKKAQIETNG